MSLFFPDNPLREARYRELFADINQSLHLLHEKTAEFQRDLDSAATTVRDKFGNLKSLAGTTRLTLEEKDVADITLPLGIANTIASTTLGIIVSRGIQVRLLADPARQAWAAAKLFGRLGFTRGGVLRGAGGFGAAALIGLLIQNAGEAIHGAITRDELRRGIGELLDPRANAYRTSHLMSIAAHGVAAIANAVDALPPTVPEADVLATIERAYARARAQMEALSLENAVAELIKLDRRRGSYQVDDVSLSAWEHLGVINDAQDERALDVPKKAHDAGVRLILHPWHGRANQRWSLQALERDQERGWGLRSDESNLYLNAAAPDGRPNGDIIQWHRETGDNSLWLLVPLPLTDSQHGERRFMLVSKITGDVLEADTTGRPTLGAPSGVPGQRWRLRA